MRCSAQRRQGGQGTTSAACAGGITYRSATLPFALWPFTRLVHVFSAPLFYLWRPYVVYRGRSERFGARASRPGWECSERTRR